MVMLVVVVVVVMALMVRVVRADFLDVCRHLRRRCQQCYLLAETAIHPIE
jgi:hypothetical protein